MAGLTLPPIPAAESCRKLRTRFGAISLRNCEEIGPHFQKNPPPGGSGIPPPPGWPNAAMKSSRGTPTCDLRFCPRAGQGGARRGGGGGGGAGGGGGGPPRRAGRNPRRCVCSKPTGGARRRSRELHMQFSECTPRPNTPGSLGGELMSIPRGASAADGWMGLLIGTALSGTAGWDSSMGQLNGTAEWDS